VALMSDDRRDVMWCKGGFGVAHGQRVYVETLQSVYTTHLQERWTLRSVNRLIDKLLIVTES